jgi:spermidine synthase
LVQAPVYKQLLSYLFPVSIRQSSSEQNKLLELSLYRGQYQLSTEDAYYSDGRRYRPLVLAFEQVEDTLPKVQSVLLLGAGIGSAVQILMHKGFHPDYTFVDTDEKILEWATELQSGSGEHIEAVHQDAQLYMATNSKKYDLLIVDIFTDRIVPGFAITETFLKQCRQGINPGGSFIMNYIINSEAEWQVLQHNLQAVFTSPHTHELGTNRIITASV